MTSKDKKEAGFTLIELAIVFTIFSFVVVSIAGGKALADSVTLLSVAADANKYVGAVKKFYDVYGAVPGDLPNADQFWPSAFGGGDGDGYSIYSVEDQFGWEHLSLSGILDSGQYIGGTALSHYTVGVTMPESRVSGAGFQLTSNVHPDGLSDADLAIYLTAAPEGTVTTVPFHQYGERNYILLGRQFTGSALALHSSAGPMWNGALSIKEAIRLENKLDDGKPGTGVIMVSNVSRDAFSGPVGRCSLAGGAGTDWTKYEYDIANVTDPDTPCIIAFPFDPQVDEY